MSVSFYHTQVKSALVLKTYKITVRHSFLRKPFLIYQAQKSQTCVLFKVKQD